MITGNLPPYPNYKASGVPWLGDVPSHWEMRRGKWLFEKQSRPVRKEDEVITCFRNGVVTLRRNRRVQGFTNSIKEIGYQGIRKGDLVIHAMDAFAGAIGVSDSDGKGSPVYSVCRSAKDVNPHFYGYLLREMSRKEWILALATGIRERSTDFRYSTFGTQELPLPPRDEQVAIVRYLDYVDGRIRRYLRAKQELIARLAEQKQALIHQAVTGQIDVRSGQPYPAYKDAGVEWLGRVPEHWEMRRCRFLFQEIDSRSKDGLEQHLSMSQELGLVPSHLVSKSLVSTSYAGGKLCAVDDIVLNRLKAHLGVFALSQYNGVISPDYTVLRAYDTRGVEYFEKVLRSPAFRYELRIRSKGIVEGFWRLYTDDFNDIRLPVPSAKERVAIVEHIHKTSNEINCIVATTKAEIALLREYRTRLIADVVTGQVDVRAVAAGLPAASPVDEMEAVDEEGGEEGIEEGVMEEMTIN